MRKTDSMIFLGLLLVLIVLAMFVGFIVGNGIGYQRGLIEAEKIILGRTN